MAFNMDALLRIKAAVTGADQVAALGNKFNQVQGAAAKLTSGVGPLGQALGALAPAVTVGGLGALVMKTIEAGDNMNDLSQRTGVSVEALARFKKAAATSGTDIDAVAKSLGRLSKGMYEAATTGKGPAADALKTLGISAKDAAGNLKSADQVTLEIADRFKAMPDGVEKTALAMQLFGKSGVEMIPMLNEGGKAIDSLSVKMTAAFAKKADEYNDKLAVLSGKVGGLAAGLTVALLPALNAIATALTFVVDGFTKLPAPIQATVGIVAGLAIALAALAPVATSVVTILGALSSTGIATAIAGVGTAITTALGGALAWVGSTFLPTMLAFFSGPAGWITLAVIAIGAMVIAFREPIGKFLAWVGEGIANVAKTIGDGITGAISSAWQWLTEAVGNVAQALSRPFEVAVGGIKAAVRGVLQYVANNVNIVTSLVNRLIRGFNSLPAPDLPLIPMIQVPSFQGGGYTGNGPRSGGIDGRGGFMAMLHPQETVIDHTRGAAAALGGVATAATSAPSITIQTGPIYRLPDGTDTVSVGDLQAAMQATAAAVMGQLRRPGAQLALGIR